MSLEIRPERMRAVDQDAGINATIRYAWNGGFYLFFFVICTINLERTN